MVQPAPHAPLKSPGDQETVLRWGSKVRDMVVNRVDATTLTRRFKGSVASPRGADLGTNITAKYSWSTLKENIHTQGDAGIHVPLPP